MEEEESSLFLGQVKARNNFKKCRIDFYGTWQHFSMHHWKNEALWQPYQSYSFKFHSCDIISDITCNRSSSSSMGAEASPTGRLEVVHTSKQILPADSLERGFASIIWLLPTICYLCSSKLLVFQCLQLFPYLPFLVEFLLCNAPSRDSVTVIKTWSLHPCCARAQGNYEPARDNIILAVYLWYRPLNSHYLVVRLKILSVISRSHYRATKSQKHLKISSKISRFLSTATNHIFTLYAQF